MTRSDSADGTVGQRGEAVCGGKPAGPGVKHSRWTHIAPPGETRAAPCARYMPIALRCTQPRLLLARSMRYQSPARPVTLTRVP
jgi:hypothetical protein